MKVNLKAIAELIKDRVIALVERLKAEPVLVRSTLMLLAGAGIIEISGAQMDKIEAISLIVLFVLGAGSIRRNVTPANKQQPTDSPEPQEQPEVEADQGGQE